MYYEVFSRERILILDELRYRGEQNDGRNMTDILRTIRLLETDPEFRKRFFSVPLLTPGAADVVTGICDKAVHALREASKRIPRLRAHAERAIATDAALI